MKRIIGIATVLMVVALQTPAADRAKQAMETHSLFETFLGLAGEWRGKSTKGWDEVIRIKAIAGGSVVVVNSFDAHPGEEMLTTIHPDGERLMLTHYCIAGNQPTLALTSVNPRGDELTFTFQSATNLSSRDQGHMDKVIYRFHSDDHFSSRWTWFQDGEESWMEEIQYRRLGREEQTPSAATPETRDAPALPR